MSDLANLRLKRYLGDVLHGKAKLKPDSSFLQAICLQPDPVDSITRAIGCKDGLSFIGQSMRFDLSPVFMNGVGATFLEYLQPESLATISGGAYLQQVVKAIAHPPTFLNALKNAFCAGTLGEKAQVGFGWLLMQLISFEEPDEYHDIAKDESISRRFSSSSSVRVRTIGHRIKHFLDSCQVPSAVGAAGPGGRHDNDLADFRKIIIRPTADEIVSREPAFLRQSDELRNFAKDNTGLNTHIDNQFRLLREDMLYDMREEVDVETGKKKGFKRGFTFKGLHLDDVHVPDSPMSRWGLTLKCSRDIPQFKGERRAVRRKDMLKDNRKLLRHGSLCCLKVGEDIVAFPTTTRDEDLLSRNPPVIVLAFEGKQVIAHVLAKLKAANPEQVCLIQVDTAIFSYEPVLKALQSQHTLGLADQLLGWDSDNAQLHWPGLSALAENLRSDPKQDVRRILGLQGASPIVLDRSQLSALVSGITQRLSLIQGPPGTGKSFIGSMITKVLHDKTYGHILVVCYTNHALDQFLEELLAIGIPPKNVVRLGSKANPRTDILSLRNQQKDYKLQRADWTIIDKHKKDVREYRKSLQTAFKSYKGFRVKPAEFLSYLEMVEPTFYEAFRVVPSTDGMTRIGMKKRKVGELYLIENWLNGWDARPCQDQPNVIAAADIWGMGKEQKEELAGRWAEEIFLEEVEHISELAAAYNKAQASVDERFAETDAHVLRNKRIVACTTTGAAKYIHFIQTAARPDVVIVEEAGEILESHIITALAPETRQLVLIGDHKQLRPKINNYQLSAEKGQGFDLNCSLFERLVLEGYPHEVLLQQHRMRPEISSLVRSLTYPDLCDAPKTENRPHIRGIDRDIVFINHSHPEDLVDTQDRRDLGSTSSKQNSHEVEMVLKIVRYLGQQGYGTDAIVILTPYLGQLFKLLHALKKTTDPVLNDLDSFDLVRAGLIPEETAKLSRKSIRLATIDNYQGEESDIVVVSLTRSNPNHDIGFMSAPERLNVLLSRARLGLFMIGNVDTFTHARKGSALWSQFFELLRKQHSVFDGLPVHCERHPTRKEILSNPQDFDDKCPEGGCLEICGATLSCQIHQCKSTCHQLSDHSKLPCTFILEDKCPSGHVQSWQCSKTRPPSCAKCERQRKRVENERQRVFEREKAREKEKELHEKEMARLDEEIKEEQAKVRDRRIAAERREALRRKQQDLRDAATRAEKGANIKKPIAPTPLNTSYANKHSSSSTPQGSTDASSSSPESTESSSPSSSWTTPSSSPIASEAPETETDQIFEAKNRDLERPEDLSPSELEWKRQKDIEGEQNESLDQIMAMTGLEEVKSQILSVKTKLETSQRQGVSVHERFNVAMLGNPGTGKTTIARLYAKFLASVDALPGSEFIETTGSRLSNDGVSGIKTHIETILNAGGGTLFIDEAYQLTNGSSIQGKQVLDFILAEMENNVGKIVFIVAGYKKQMESFFEHNPGIPSRVPYQLLFSDYTDEQLRIMLRRKIEKTYKGQMKVEGGLCGLYMRIVTRRIGRGRGREGFGNARALENVLAQITERQARRIGKERRTGGRPDDFLLVKEDLIGPEPSQALRASQAMKKLHSMIGLTPVKDSVDAMVEQLSDNYQRELKELKPVETSLNKVFSGPPGTGKTTVAKLYGQILADIGLLSNGEVVIKNPSDFIGSVLGESEEKTRGILSTTKGKVLLIDEAYMLYQSNGTGAANMDPYRTAVIDTLVSEVQNVPGDDRCVLMAGYKAEMEAMFQNVNPGLARRFDMANAFTFEDFSDIELRQVLELKLKDQQLQAEEGAKDIAIRVLSRERDRPNFGNGGAVENLLSRAKNHYQKRRAKPSADSNFAMTLEAQDFDPDFQRERNAELNLDTLFADIVGREDVKEKLAEYTKIAKLNQLRNKDPRAHIPTRFVFKGPPGTGKTTVARKIGQVFYSMNLLSSAEVHECSAKDLAGQYVGQTAPKVAQVFDKALGQVLFIDEAYRLGDGGFGKEAMDEIVALITNEKYCNKLVIILAGYDEDMNRLLAVNPGLASRFPQEFMFHNMHPVDCMQVLFKEIDKEDIAYPDLHDPSPSRVRMDQILDLISSLPSWGNARDMKTLAGRIIQKVMLAANGTSELVLSGELAVSQLQEMYDEQRHRQEFASFSHMTRHLPMATPTPPAPPSSSTAQAHATKTSTESTEITELSLDTDSNDGRDPGVSDEIWHQLQQAKRAADKAKAEVEQDIRNKEERVQKAEAEAKKAEEEERAFHAVKTDLSPSEEDEKKRLLEQMRLKALYARAEEERLRQEFETKKKEEERKKKEEAKIQAKLRNLGQCVAGFQWTKVGDGYRCRGGAHFVSSAELGIQV